MHRGEEFPVLLRVQFDAARGLLHGGRAGRCQMRHALLLGQLVVLTAAKSRDQSGSRRSTPPQPASRG
jgi:hypothetical protein